jgi:uncharacterized protein YegL
MRTLIGVILDKSGSMESVKADTIGGYNRFLTEQKALPTASETNLVLTLFDTSVVTSAVRPLAEVPELNAESYKPDGFTALLDAVHRTVRQLEENVGYYDRVLVLILTDGEENSSKEVTRAAVKALVEEKQATGKWTFVYMGANVDAFAEAGKIGVPVGNAMAYSATPAGVQLMSSGLCAASSSYMSNSARATKEYFKETT